MTVTESLLGMRVVRAQSPWSQDSFPYLYALWEHVEDSLLQSKRDDFIAQHAHNSWLKDTREPWMKSR
jgi:hypothetical protein